MTSHELANKLLLGPNLPIFHFDPSKAGQDDDRDTSLSEPAIEEHDNRDGVPVEVVEGWVENGQYAGLFLYICGEQDVPEAMSEDESKIREAATKLVNSIPLSRPNVATPVADLLALEAALKLPKHA